MKRARIILADDHTLTLEGMRAVLASHHEIIAAVANGQALVEAALLLKPDLIILDITMPLLNGIDAAAEIRKRLPAVLVLFVTMHVNPVYVEAALEAGGTGYVVKSAAREELLVAVDCVLDNKIYISPSLGVAVLGRSARGARLSERERDTLRLIAQGKASKEIAFVLNISAKTVAFHRENIRRKLGLRTTAELTKYAMELGLVEQ